MSSTIYDRIQRLLSWKKVIAFNAILFMVTVIPLSLRLAVEDTENRSGAAGQAPVPSVTPPPSYPSGFPQIERVSEFFGKRGDTIVILGANFGEYQWGSKLFVGDVATKENDIVRWSNNVIEVAIPESARTGKVWIVVNEKQAQWDGSLLLYDVGRAGKIGVNKNGPNTATVWVSNGENIIKGMIEIAHISEPLEISVIGGSVQQKSQTSDSIGKKTKIEFVLNSPLGSNLSDILTIEYPGIGGLEITRAELYDAGGRLIPVYADPLAVKF